MDTQLDKMGLLTDVNRPLIELVRQVGAFQHVDHSVLIPAPDPASFEELIRETARTAAAYPGKGLVLLLDSLTAGKYEELEAVRAAAARVIVFGAPHPEWVASPNVVSAPGRNALHLSDRFLAVFSSTLSVFLVGLDERQESDPSGTFEGAWTVQRRYVQRVIETLLSGQGEDVSTSLAEVDAGAIEQVSAFSTWLMATLGRQFISSHRDIAMDRHDLFAVLKVLKAISSKRRAHDVLFVFVEQIARTIEIDRCSIVRIWGDGGVGQVVASHENEKVHDLAIDLAKYPELRYMLETRQKIVVNDVTQDPLLMDCAESLQRADINSLLVVPIVLFDPEVGSLLLRAARRNSPFTRREISFCEVVAEAAANALERAHLFDTIQKANERLERLAVTDGLTGVFNHRYFRERLEGEFERARRYDTALSCIFFDIDDFKKVNDVFGHLEGDSVLQEIAACALKAIRKSDVLARYGGEEFVIILPQTNEEGAKIEAERLLAMLSDHRYKGLPKHYKLTVSIGVAVYDRNTMPDCESLIGAADGALYKAKRQGKRQVMIAANN